MGNISRGNCEFFVILILNGINFLGVEKRVTLDVCDIASIYHIVSHIYLLNDKWKKGEKVELEETRISAKKVLSPASRGG